MPRYAAKLAACLLIVAPPSVAQSAARADEVDRAVQNIISLDQRVHIMALEFSEAPRESPELPLRRLVDAEGLLGLGRADEATTLLLDVALRWPGTPAARDAGFLLGDALFQLGDVMLARRYYEDALASADGTARQRKALVRLVQIALTTGDLTHVDRYLALLANDKVAARDPAVQYLDAKVRYQRGELDEAARGFKRIMATSAPASIYVWRARYFAATIQLTKADLEAASRGYQAMLAGTAPDAGAREIQDLARLAVARIDYQQGRHDRAAAGYRSISRDSKHWPDALYELGWTYVGAKQFENAHAAFAQLLRSRPDGPRAPELKLMLANIDLRQGRLPEAQRGFSGARDRLQPAQDKLREVIVRSQAEPGFLDSLTNRGHDQLDLAAFVPESTRAWVRADPEVSRLLAVADEVAWSQRAVAEAGGVIERVEGALADAARMDPLELFLDLRRTRQLSSQLFGELAALRDRFTTRARRLEAPHLNAAEVAELGRIDAERAAIDGQLGAPSKLDVRAAERPMSQLRALVLRLEGPGSKLRYGIAEALRAGKPAPVSGAREHAVAERLRRLTEQEQRLQDDVLRRLGPSQRAVIDRELEVASRAGAVMSQLFALDARLHAEAETRLSALERLVGERRQDMDVTNTKLAGVERDTQNLGEVLVRMMYTRIADRVYDLLVRADVGLIDVSWAAKERSMGGLRAVLLRRQRELDVVTREVDLQEDALNQRFDRALRQLPRLAD